MKAPLKILIFGSSSEGSITHSFRRSLIKLNNSVELIDTEKIYSEALERFTYFLPGRIFKRGFNFLFWKQIASRVNKLIKNQVKNKEYDLIIVMKGWEINPKTLIALKKFRPSLKIFCFTGDNPLDKYRFSDSNSWIRKSIPIYDSYFIWAESLRKPLLLAGAKKAFTLPVAYDPELHYKLKTSDKERKIFGSEISFIGTWDKYREDQLKELTKYKLKIWGNLWENSTDEIKKFWQRKEAVGKDFSKICNSSKIIINFVRKPEIPSHNMRNFEIPACGGFQLSTRTNEVKEYFKENEEIGFFRSKEEMKEKVEYFLKNDAIRKKIALKGYVANRKNNYLERMKFLLKVFYWDK